MAEPINSGKFKRGTPDPFLSDLLKARRDSMQVSEEDRQNWEAEAARLRADPHAEKLRHEEERREAEEERKRKEKLEAYFRNERKRKLASVLLVLSVVGLIIYPGTRRALKDLVVLVIPRSRPAVVVSPTPSPPPPLPVFSGDQKIQAEALLVTRFEVRWVRKRAKLASGQPLWPWTGLTGRASLFGPIDPAVNLVDHLLELRPQALASDRHLVLKDLAVFIERARTPQTRLLADALVMDPASVAHNGLRLLESPAGPDATSDSMAALATGVCLAMSGGDLARAEHWLGKSALWAAQGDPWPGWALALLRVAQSRAADAARDFDGAVASMPEPELTAFQRAWLHVQAGQRDKVDGMLAPLQKGTEVAAVCLLRASLDVAAGRKPEASKRLTEVGDKLDSLPAGLRSHILSMRVAAGDPGARQLMERAWSADEAGCWVALDLGRSLIQERRIEDALACYRSHLRRSPGDLVARRELARLLGTRGALAQTLGELAVIALADPKGQEATLAIPQICKTMKRPDLAAFLSRGP